MNDSLRLCVGAGGGDVVEVHELQPAGKRRMSAEDFLRGRRPQGGDRLGPEPVVPAESVERIDAHQLEAALKHLPDDQREAVLLCDLWGFRYDEIAEIMSCPLGTVQSRIARGRALLATLLADAAGRQEQRR